jgi:HEAT repeat protein
MTFHSKLNIIKTLLGIVSIQLLSGISNVNNEKTDFSSIDSLFSNLVTMEEKSLEFRKSILDAIGKDTIIDEVEMLIHLYDINKRSNALMSQLLTQTLGEIGDDKVIPILMEIAQNNDLPITTRSSAVEILSNKQAPELVDFLVEMLGDPTSRDQVNEFALNVMGDLSEERMIMALLDAYQLGRNRYYSLLNTLLNGLDNYENPKMKSVYKKIASNEDFPSRIRLKAFRGLAGFSDDPGTIDVIIELLNDPDNYVYYQEIITILMDYGIYDDYQVQLRMAAFKAMQKDSSPFGMEYE